MIKKPLLIIGIVFLMIGFAMIAKSSLGFVFIGIGSMMFGAGAGTK